MEDELASQQIVQHDYYTCIDYYLETIEPHIADQLSSLSIDDTINAIIGYSHPHSTTKLDILDLLEARLSLLLNTS